MKKITYTICLLLSLIFFLSENATAQEATSSRKMNNIKTNFLTAASLGYERGFGDHFSLTVFGTYFPKFQSGNADEGLGRIGLSEASVGYHVEARYYTTKKGKPLVDFYISLYALQRSLNTIGSKVVERVSATDVTTYNIDVTLPSGLTSYGLLIGWQTISKKNIVVDFNLGAGYYEIANIPEFNLPPGSDSDLGPVQLLSDLSSGIMPRFSLSVGYAF